MRHFRFGKNWAKFKKNINESDIQQSVIDIVRLLGMYDLSGKSVIDIGSGSGIHSAAFYKFKPLKVDSIDYDQDSVNTTREFLSSMAHPVDKNVWKADILNLETFHQKKYDVVYAWGVLHHTGNLHLAIENAATLVDREGLLVIALYRKTFLCEFWKIEKRIYSRSPYVVQKIVFFFYITLFFILYSVIRRKNFLNYVKNYKSNRGMNFFIDVHDWLGGYPYESISSFELRTKMSKLGFEELRSFTYKPGIGLFGSGCDQFVFKKSD